MNFHFLDIMASSTPDICKSFVSNGFTIPLSKDIEITGEMCTFLGIRSFKGLSL
jgi:hypothetical protein